MTTTSDTVACMSNETYHYFDIRLYGTEQVEIIKTSSNCEVKREFNPKTKQYEIVEKRQLSQETQRMTFTLNETTKEKIDYFRREKMSSFVLKVEDKLYHCLVPADVTFLSSNIFGIHKCRDCKRLSAAKDANGGCAKVRNRSRYIEKYPWITTGYETFATKADAFVVAKCSHFVEDEPRPRQ